VHPIHDIAIFNQLILEPAAFYIMDRGYIDFGHLYRFTQQSAFFVIRAKNNLDYSQRSYRPVDCSTGLQIELFSKWIKQHLRIKAFYDTSKNAIKT